LAALKRLAERALSASFFQAILKGGASVTGAAANFPEERNFERQFKVCLTMPKDWC
jgi:hypothetical protein